MHTLHLYQFCSLAVFSTLMSLIDDFLIILQIKTIQIVRLNEGNQYSIYIYLFVYLFKQSSTNIIQHG